MTPVETLKDTGAIHERFRQHVLTSVLAPVRQLLDRYVDELAEAVSAMETLAADPQASAGAEGAETAEDDRGAARARFRLAERFRGRFGDSLFAPSRTARDALFSALDAVAIGLPELPDVVRTPTRGTDPMAPDLVRPAWWQRAIHRMRRRTEREIPARALAELYLAELDRRLVPAAGDAARLLAVATAEIRWRFHARTDSGAEPGDAPPELEAAGAAVAVALETVARGVVEEFGQALDAGAVKVSTDGAEAARRQATSRRARRLEAWTLFERALTANVVSEAVLARALASMEAAVAVTAGQMEDILAHRGVEPLGRLADGLGELGRRAEEELGRDYARVLEGMAGEASRLFEAEVPRVNALPGRLREQADRLVQELAKIPDEVPGDLHISEHRVDEVPTTPRGLQLRDAPLEDLLRTACTGALPRWLERSLETAATELEAVSRELERARHAVRFQLQAPLRGGFNATEARELATGIMDRTTAQIEDLRAEGFESLDALVAGLETRAREEAETLRSAVSNREFLRIQSEIAEEQATQQLATGVEQARSAAAGLGRAVRRIWDAARGGVATIRGWAERQLGVAEVEREAMLESLEQSLLGADQAVDLPALYLQLFDVEADVPWDELLVSREDEMDAIGRAYHRWVEDRSATVAVVGEKGSGKTTLLRLARQQILDEAEVVTAAFDHSIDDPAELEAALAAAFELQGEGSLVDEINARQPAVAILEDAHHLFVRTVGGFAAMEALLEVIAATGGNVLWIVTFDAFAWRYLDRVMGIGAHFVYRVTTTNLSPEKLEQAIMARHEVSGFALSFELSREEPNRGRWARLLGRDAGGEMSRKESQRRRFFRDLAGIAEGNIVLALFYWLRSIRRIDEHVLVLGDPEIIDLEFLEQLPLAQLHTIAAIILHGGLSGSAHQRVFQLPAAESRLQLATLADSHMVFLSRQREYKINKVLYRPFVRLLVSKNVF